jgi:YD repeat-containing protein
VRANDQYLATTAPGTELFRPSEVIPRQTTTVYDGAGRATASIVKKNAPSGQPGGEELYRTTTYSAGDRTDVTPPSGATSTSALVDAHRRTTEFRQYHAGTVAGSADPSGYDATKYFFDRRNQLKKAVSPAGITWEYEYDLLGRRIKVIDPDKGTTTSTYDDADQLTSTTDGLGTTLAYTYDGAGRKTSAREGSASGPKRAEWIYGLLADGTKVNGHLVKSIRYAVAGGADAYMSEVNGIDSGYRPTSSTVTIPASETGLAGSYQYVFTYKANGAPNTTRIPALGDGRRETLTYTYDAVGQPLKQVSGYGTAPDTAVVDSTGYTSFGELGSYTLADANSSNVDVVRTYDETTRRLAQIWTRKETAPTDVANVRYSYDDSGNVTKIADSVSGDNQCFRSDYLRRVTDAWTPASGEFARRRARRSREVLAVVHLQHLG